ncbi:ATP-dependent zinc metalloprotease FtsH [Myxococcota bacterium]
MSGPNLPPPVRRPPNPGPSNDNGPTWRGWVVLGMLLLAWWAWHGITTREDSRAIIPYSSFYQLVEDNRVERVTVRGQTVTGALRAVTPVDGRDLKEFRTLLPLQDDRELLPLLREKGVRLEVESAEQSIAMAVLVQLLPFALLVGVWLWMSRRAQRMMGSGGPFGSILKGRTRRFEKEAQVSVRFDDVAGLRSAKQDLAEIVEFLKEPQRFRRLGGKVPRGVLLVGPPGTGKTLLARAVAGESGVPFFSINGSEFIELFVGVGASRVRELFDEAKKVAPAIIFIDEIDAVGRARGTGMGGGHDEREQTLNQLLSEMDGFSRNDLTVVMAATNRPDVLDQALLRPGRFDRRVVIDRPELVARKAILLVHTKGTPLSADADLELVARNTPGFSGADLANLVNEAALGATRREADSIEPRDFTDAYDKIVLGDPRETKLDPAEKRRVAVHEAGHAVAAHYSEHCEPLHRVTIIPRGMALGVTQQTPAADRHIMTQPEIEARLKMIMGGYAAELTVFGDVSSGAASDLQRATELGFKMVAHFGMSERIGPVFFEHRTEHPFLGQVLATESGTSDATVHLIEQEVRCVLSLAVQGATEVISHRREGLDALVHALLERETVEREELLDLLGPPRSLRPVPTMGPISTPPE